MQNLNLSPGSKEYNFNNKKVLENSGSLSNCNTKKKINYIIIITIFSLFLISITIFLILYFKLEKTNKYSNKEDKEEINEFICSEGYFLFTDHLNNSSCYKCSIDKCKTCVGDIDKNTCLICINSYNPKYNNNTIISCDFKESKKLNETNNISSVLSDEINQKNDNEIPISKTKKI